VLETGLVEEFDRDGAVLESAEAAGVSRATLIRRAAIGGGALLGSGALMGALPSLAGAAAKSDVAILNFALTLEYLESAFYKEALAKGKLTGETLHFAKVVSAHEAAHVAFLKTALGSAAVASPSFNFKGTTANLAMFQKTAMALEDTGVAAYAGQGPLIKDKKYTAAALSVHSVEARHASWIREIIGKGNAPVPAPVPFDAAKTMKQVLAIVKSTGFITS
jgi:Ferritin-like domain